MDLSRTIPLLSDQAATIKRAATLSHADLDTLDKALTNLAKALRSAASKQLRRHKETNPASPLFSGVSMFAAIGRSQDEVAYSRALAWLLHPRGNHQLRNAGLFRFLRSVPWPEARPDWLTEANLRSSIVTAHAEYPLGKHGRADVLVEVKSGDRRRTRALLIEMKLGAGEGEGQLCKYENAFRDSEAVLIFLTPEGRPPHTAKAASRWIRMSFRHIAWTLVKLANDHDEHHAGPFLHTFARGVLEETCDYVGGHSVTTILDCNNPALIESVLAK